MFECIHVTCAYECAHVIHVWAHEDVHVCVCVHMSCMCISMHVSCMCMSVHLLCVSVHMCVHV